MSLMSVLSNLVRPVSENPDQDCAKRVCLDVKKTEDPNPRLFLERPLASNKELFNFKPFSFQFVQPAGLSIQVTSWTSTHMMFTKVKGPTPRSGHRIVCDDANVYSFGGYQVSDGSQQLFPELWEYNTMMNEWDLKTTYGEAPRELASHSMVLHGNFLIVFGGTGLPFGESSSNKTHVCDLKTMTWHAVQTSGHHPPPPLYGQAVALDAQGEAFYTVGGTGGYEYTMDIHKLDLRSFEWEPVFVSRGQGLATEPNPRYRHEIAIYNNKIFVFGGGDNTLTFELKNVPCFDLRTKKWTKVATHSSEPGEFPRPRKCHGLARRGDAVYISGGITGNTIFDEIWKFDLKTLKWKKLPVVLPIPTYFHASAISPAGCLFIFGGVKDARARTRSDQLFKVWLDVPSLQELCTNAAHHYARSTNPPCIDDFKNSKLSYCQSRLPRKVPRLSVPLDFKAEDIKPRVPIARGSSSSGEVEL